MSYKNYPMLYFSPVIGGITIPSKAVKSVLVLWLKDWQAGLCDTKSGRYQGKHDVNA